MTGSKMFLVTLSAVLMLVACSAEPPPATEQQPPVLASTAAAPALAPTTSLPVQPEVSAPTSSLPSFPTPEPVTEAAGENESPLYTVQRGEVVEMLTLNGSVALIRQGASFDESGVIAEVLVEQGSTVEAGQLLASLATNDLEGQLAKAEADYQQSTTALQRTADLAQIEVRRAELALQAAQSELAELRRPPLPDVVAAARATAQGAQANLAKVRNDMSAAKNAALEELNTAALELEGVQTRYNEALARYERKKDDRSVRDEFEAARQELRLAEEKVNKARIVYDTSLGNEVAAVQDAEAQALASQAALDKLLNGPDPFDVAAAERAVRGAQIAVEEARLKTRPDPALVSIASVADNQIQSLRQQLEARRLYSPINGTVVSSELSKGLTATAGSPLVMIATLDQREVVAMAPDNSSSASSNTRLTVGQEVSLVFARYPGQVIPGTISRAPGIPTDLADTNVSDSNYGVKFDPGAISVDIGDLAEVRVLLGRSPNALWLPPEAIQSSRDRSFVTLRDGDEDRRVDILTGLASAERVEILRGLNEGDTVVGAARSSR